PWLAALAAQQLDPLAVDPQLLRARAPGGGQTGPRLEPPDAGRGLAGQIVGAPAGVRLEIEKALVLTLQGGKQRQQRHMLVNVRKVAGVVLVTVFQAEDLREQQVTKRPRAAPWAAGSSPVRGLAAQSAAGDFAPMNDSGKQRQQRHMLVNVRKVAGVMLVTVFQAEGLREQQVTKRPRAAPWAAGSSPARGLAAQSAAGDFAPMNNSGKQRQQRHMLVDIRKVAGVVLVTVFQAEDLREQQVTKRPRAAPWAAGSSPVRGLAAQSAAGDFAPMNNSGKQRQQRHMLVDIRKV